MNFQNIPRGNKLIKAGFIPKYEALALFDYEQIEYRLLAYYLHEAVGESTLVDAFIAGADPHSTSAELVLGHCDNDKERQIGKTLNFSIMYAGGVPTILRQMAKADIPCDRPQAKAWLAELHRQMPGLKDLNEMIAAEVYDKGYIFDIFGRRYHPDPKIPYNDAIRKLLNALIQGCAAGLTRKAIVKIADGLEAEHMLSHQVNIVHDEIIMDCPESDLDLLAERVPTWMGNTLLEETLPITTEMSVSFTNWADKEQYSD